MYVYDEANNLAKAIQESREYKEYKQAKEDVSQNPEMKAKIFIIKSKKEIWFTI